MFLSRYFNFLSIEIIFSRKEKRNTFISRSISLDVSGWDVWAEVWALYGDSFIKRIP